MGLELILNTNIPFYWNTVKHKWTILHMQSSLPQTQRWENKRLPSYSRLIWAFQKRWMIKSSLLLSVKLLCRTMFWRCWQHSPEKSVRSVLQPKGPTSTTNAKWTPHGLNCLFYIKSRWQWQVGISHKFFWRTANSDHHGIFCEIPRALVLWWEIANMHSEDEIQNHRWSMATLFVCLYAV